MMEQMTPTVEEAPSNNHHADAAPAGAPAPATLAPQDNSFYPGFQKIAFQIGDKTVSMETGKLARSAGGAVTLTCGETMILVTGTVSETPRPGIDFFPLLVDFEEKMYCVGRLPGGYLKREGRPSEKAILTSRLIDRPIRPLFPEGFRNDVQIVAAPLAADSVHPTDVLSILAASMALELANAPFEGPVGAARVGFIDGKFIINPTYAEIEKSALDLVVAGTEDSIMMVEAGAQMVPEATIIEAIALAHEEIKKQVAVQKQFRQQCGVPEKKPFVPANDITPMFTFIDEQVGKDIDAAYHNFDRDQRKELLSAAKEKAKAALDALAEDHPLKKLLALEPDCFTANFKTTEKKKMRAMIMNEGVRSDGRKADEIRPINCQVGVVPRVHGSGLFTRGNTQVLSIATLGSPGDAQRLDGVDPATEKRWLHHYAFPGYSVGEVKPMRGAGRREIGHGALAERAVGAALPEKEVFPYTLRVNSEVLESNGSTSMASTCGTTLALMDAGVPLLAPVGGIAMGLIKEGEKFAVLSDIQGIEDFLGDMDFKVTGPKEGVTALQMDIKIRGISVDIMRQALEQARLGRLHILGKMAEAISEPRAELSPWAPRIVTLKIDPDTIGAVIGPGGKMIRSIIERTGTNIDIEDDGTVTVSAVSAEGIEEACRIIQDLTRKIDPGLLTVGKVVRVIPVGAFVELAPGKDGMVHISQLLHQRVEKVEDVLNVGDSVVVRVTDIDDRGRINLTMKGVSNEERATFGFPPLPEPDPNAPRFEDRGGGGGGRPPFRGGGGDRGGRGGGGGGGRGRY